MKFKTLDERMRTFETAHDHCVLPGLYMIARLDGRGFARLTRDVLGLDPPYHERFRDLMITTTKELMRCGMHTLYAYTQSDEISLLFHRDDSGFGRKLRKLNSVLAATASASFTLQIGQMATFDCRISQLPGLDLVLDYFRWRSDDAHRNALNTYCYWALRKAGARPSEASKKLQRTTVAEKKEMLLREHDIDFNRLPAWHRRGTGLLWQLYDREWIDPETGEVTTVVRKRIEVLDSLPTRDDYHDLVRAIVESAEAAPQLSKKKQPLEEPEE